MARLDTTGAPLDVLRIQRHARNTKEHWTTGALEMAIATDEIIGRMLADCHSTLFLLAIEIPTNWFNERGTASKDSEAIQKLYFTVGAVLSLAQTHPHVVECYGVEPNQWKGQVRKEIMLQRANRYMAEHASSHSQEITNHDAAEALMLGVFANAKFYPTAGQNTVMGLSSPFTKITESKSIERCTGGVSILSPVQFRGGFTITQHIG